MDPSFLSYAFFFRGGQPYSRRGVKTNGMGDGFSCCFRSRHLELFNYNLDPPTFFKFPGVRRWRTFDGCITDDVLRDGDNTDKLKTNLSSALPCRIAHSTAPSQSHRCRRSAPRA